MTLIEKALAVLGVIGIVVAALLFQQHRLTAARQDAAAAQKKVAQLQVDLKAALENTRVVTQYVDRVQVVHEKGDAIVKEVPVYVTREADSACVVPRGFVRLHDAAAANVPLGSPGATDAAPSGVALSAVASTVAGNYTICHAIAEQLSALQAVIRLRQASAPSAASTP